MISGSIRMIAIATEPTNAFNADYLDNWLRPMSLAERDELWSVRATYHAKSEGNAIDTLIQWVLVNGLTPIEDIGRASGRDRGCPDVWFWVVAVSLKKKK